jgi:hypothetical protein
VAATVVVDTRRDEVVAGSGVVVDGSGRLVVVVGAVVEVVVSAVVGVADAVVVVVEDATVDVVVAWVVGVTTSPPRAAVTSAISPPTTYELRLSPGQVVWLIVR